MSSLAVAPVTYEAYLCLPDPENAQRLELHDGEVVTVPPARPRHVAIQHQLLELLSFVRDFEQRVVMEYPYKPAPNYQYWVADVAVIPGAVLKAMNNWSGWETYAPSLVIEVKSPSNTERKMGRQRITSMSQGTEVFWIVDADQETVLVTTRDGVTEYRNGDSIEIPGCAGRVVSVSQIFEK